MIRIASSALTVSNVISPALLDVTAAAPVVPHHSRAQHVSIHSHDPHHRGHHRRRRPCQRHRLLQIRRRPQGLCGSAGPCRARCPSPGRQSASGPAVVAPRPGNLNGGVNRVGRLR